MQSLRHRDLLGNGSLFGLLDIDDDLLLAALEIVVSEDQQLGVGLEDAFVVHLLEGFAVLGLLPGLVEGVVDVLLVDVNIGVGGQ